jgi:hypothetical protein
MDVLAIWMTINRTSAVTLERSQLIIGTVRQAIEIPFKGFGTLAFAKASAGPDVKTVVCPGK